MSLDVSSAEERMPPRTQDQEVAQHDQTWGTEKLAQVATAAVGMMADVVRG